MVKKIVVLGPESTGKSSLCKALAQRYQTAWCPEFARTYLLKHGMSYRFEDLSVIARGQLALEEEFRAMVANREIVGSEPGATFNNPYLFIDTDMYVMKVWCEYVFGKCHFHILEEIANRSYDLYLLCDIDLPWVKDELREYPDEKPRQELYQIYKDILINQPVPWVNISGNYAEREAIAVAAIENLGIQHLSKLH